MEKKGFIIIFDKWYFILIGLLLLFVYVDDFYNSYDIDINIGVFKDKFDFEFHTTEENYTQVYLAQVKNNLSSLNLEYEKLNCEGIVAKDIYNLCNNLYIQVSDLTDIHNSIINGSFIPLKPIIEQESISEEKSIIEIKQTEHYNDSLTRTIIDEEYTYEDYEALSVPEINIYELERRVHELTNVERRSHGLKSLNYDDKLANIARKHSKDMSINNYFEHTNLKGEDPTDRADKQNYNCYKNYGSYYTEGIAENIFQNWLYSSYEYYYSPNDPSSYDWSSLEELATSTVDGWMDSPGHRENILTKEYDKEGIGVAISSDYKVYITQNFC